MNDRRSQNILAGVVVLLAIFLLLFQDKVWDWWQERTLLNDPRPSIAEISEMKKNVKFRPPETLNYHRARVSMKLHSKDTVATEVDSTAVITFKSGLKVELQPNSLITIEDFDSSKPGSLELTFLRGSVKILSEGQGIKLAGDALAKSEARLKIFEPKLDLALLDKIPTQAATPVSIIPQIDLEDKKSRKKAAKKKVEDKETLPDSYIASVIRNQRGFLNRCYAQYLRLNPDARGRIDCSLTIEPDGNISTARVIGSTISDPSLQQCVVSTLQRARFKSFHGDPIVVNYPINFE